MDGRIPELSESNETYLVTILRLSPSNEPVPLSHLAQALADLPQLGHGPAGVASNTEQSFDAHVSFFLRDESASYWACEV